MEAVYVFVKGALWSFWPLVVLLSSVYRSDPHIDHVNNTIYDPVIGLTLFHRQFSTIKNSKALEKKVKKKTVSEPTGSGQFKNVPTTVWYEAKYQSGPVITNFTTSCHTWLSCCQEEHHESPLTTKTLQSIMLTVTRRAFISHNNSSWLFFILRFNIKMINRIK